MPTLNRLSLLTLLTLFALLLTAACRAPADPLASEVSPPPATAAPALSAPVAPAPGDSSPDRFNRPIPGSAAAKPATDSAAPEMSEVIREVPVETMAQTESMTAAASSGPRGPQGPTGADGAAGAAGAAGAMDAAGSAAPAATAMPQAQSASQAPAAPAGGGTTAPTQAAGPAGNPQPATTTFQNYQRSPVVDTRQDPVSTFSLDTDRTSYQLALNWARAGYPVEPDSVRAEEWINAFDYGYAHPQQTDQFAITADVFPHPLDGRKHLARLAFQAPELRDDGKPLNVTLVLDASGSMGEGNRVAIARAAAESIRQSLRPQDRIAVVHFTDTVIPELTVAHSRPDAPAVQQSIARLQPHAATNVQVGLDLGVQMAAEIRRQRPDAYHYVILMSDGVANVDATNPFAILESAADNQTDKPLRLITLGVGIANYNDYLLEQLAQHGNGWYRYLDTPAQARSVFRRDNWLALAIPFADQTRAQVTWHPEFVRNWRIIGYENRITADHLFEQNRKEFAEIPSGAATTVFYELELTNAPAEWDTLGTVELRWVDPDSGRSLQQQAVIGDPWQPALTYTPNPLLQFGAIVALTADRYSGLPYAGGPNYANHGGDLATLLTQLQPLATDLGQLTSYQDFTFLLEQLNHTLPDYWPGDSGYSR